MMVAGGTIGTVFGATDLGVRICKSRGPLREIPGVQQIGG